MRFRSRCAKPNSALRKSAASPRGSTSTHSSPSGRPAGVMLKLLFRSAAPESSMAGVAERAGSTSRPCASTSVCRKPACSVLRPSRYPSSGVADACAAATLTSARAQAAVAAAPRNPSLLRRRGRQHVARAIGLQRAHQPRLLHSFEHPRGSVVADFQPPLHVRYGGLALGRHDPHRLVVQWILLGILAAAAALALALLPRQSRNR